MTRPAWRWWQRWVVDRYGLADDGPERAVIHARVDALELRVLRLEHILAVYEARVGLPMETDDA